MVGVKSEQLEGKELGIEEAEGRKFDDASGLARAFRKRAFLGRVVSLAA